MIKNVNGTIVNANTGTPINPAAFSTIKYIWKTPTGAIRIMNEYNKEKWHPDWTLVGRAYSTETKKKSVELF